MNLRGIIPFVAVLVVYPAFTVGAQGTKTTVVIREELTTKLEEAERVITSDRLPEAKDIAAVGAIIRDAEKAGLGDLVTRGKLLATLLAEKVKAYHNADPVKSKQIRREALRVLDQAGGRSLFSVENAVFAGGLVCLLGFVGSAYNAYDAYMQYATAGDDDLSSARNSRNRYYSSQTSMIVFGALAGMTLTVSIIRFVAE